MILSVVNTLNTLTELVFSHITTIWIRDKIEPQICPFKALLITKSNLDLNYYFYKLLK